uniref:Host-nuclease inhibitor protein n=1 Tax=viral metagenome TaxID=1070528 RepID=A0A6M3IQS5_9ZZZZ
MVTALRKVRADKEKFIREQNFEEARLLSDGERLMKSEIEIIIEREGLNIEDILSFEEIL